MVIKKIDRPKIVEQRAGSVGRMFERKWMYETKSVLIGHLQAVSKCSKYRNATSICQVIVQENCDNIISDDELSGKKNT